MSRRGSICSPSQGLTTRTAFLTPTSHSSFIAERRHCLQSAFEARSSMGHHRDSGNRWSKQKWVYSPNDICDWSGSLTADCPSRKRCEDKTSDNRSISYQSSKRWQVHLKSSKRWQVHLRSQALSTREYRCVVRCWQVQQCCPRSRKMIRDTFTKTSLKLNVEPTSCGFPSSCGWKISRNKKMHLDKRFNNRKIVW